MCKLDSDATGEFALHESPIGLGEGLVFETGLSQQTDKVQPLLCFFHCCCCVFGVTETYVCDQCMITSLVYGNGTSLFSH